MSEHTATQGLWLHTRYRESQYDGEACLLVYDVESFSDSLVGGDVKQVFEQRAGTANIFIAAPFLSNVICRSELGAGVAVQRATAYLAAKSGNVYLLEVQVDADSHKVTIASTKLVWDESTQQVRFEEPKPLKPELREGWLFHLFDSNEGLVIAPPGVHFRKSSRKHTDRFLRTANTLTTSSACGLLAIFVLATLAPRTPKRILVDTAPLLSLAYAMMRAAKVHGIWVSDVPTRSFSSYGGQDRMGRLSVNDIILISASTSGSLADLLISQHAKQDSIVTLFFLCGEDSRRPANVLCDLTITAERGFGYQRVRNFAAVGCPLCKSEFILAELEGDQFLLQQRQNRLLKIVRSTQSPDARLALTELYRTEATEVVLQEDPTLLSTVDISDERLLMCPGIRKDVIRHLRRYIPQPLALVVRVRITEEKFKELAQEAGVAQATASADVVDWSDLESHSALAEGAGVLVVFGCLSSHSTARQINATLRTKVNGGNVAYVSALTLAEAPQQYLDLKTFLSFGERGSDTFTYREARKLALPVRVADKNPWVEELDLLNSLPDLEVPVISARRAWLSSTIRARNAIFWDGRTAPLAIQRDFVFLDTTEGTQAISQADIFAVMANLFASARSGSNDLTKKPAGDGAVPLMQSVYGHVLLAPEAFTTFNDSVLKASLLRAARKSDLRYEVDPSYSRQMREIILVEMSGWSAGTGDALPEMLLALATKRLLLQDSDRATIRANALAIDLPPHVRALAQAIST